MSNIVEPPVVIVSTVTINRYSYTLSEIIPHTSVRYQIYCYNDDVFVKNISGVLKGEQYNEWTTDDWLDAFIKTKVEELNNGSIGNMTE